MATEPLLPAYPMAVVQGCPSAQSSALYDYWTLTKPEINFLIALATATAFCIGCGEPLTRFPWALLIHTVVATVLVASGAGALNQFIERQFDARMRRTARRPIAAGRIEPSSCPCFWYGVVACGNHLPGSRRATGSEPPRRVDARWLSVRLHSAQTSNTDVHAGGSVSRRHAGVDRIRRCERKARLTRVASLRHSLPLAIPAFHGDCLDVP